MNSEHPAAKRKPANWCGTKISFDPNEADQAPRENKMPVVPEGKRRYPCVTQAAGSSIMVGMRRLIPRWAKPGNLLYYVVQDGFSNEDFEYTAKSFQEAADEWNSLDFGVNITATTNNAEANFLVKYYDPEDPEDGTIASAFFPNSVDDVLVYRKTLVEPFWRGVLKNSFLHEIGHILGLRHEFANDPDPTRPGQNLETLAHLFGEANPHSVMSYDAINYINDLDKRDVKAFYELENGFKINEVSITDYLPKPLEQN